MDAASEAAGHLTSTITSASAAYPGAARNSGDGVVVGSAVAGQGQSPREDDYPRPSAVDDTTDGMVSWMLDLGIPLEKVSWEAPPLSPTMARRGGPRRPAAYASSLVRPPTCPRPQPSRCCPGDSTYHNSQCVALPETAGISTISALRASDPSVLVACGLSSEEVLLVLGHRNPADVIRELRECGALAGSVRGRGGEDEQTLMRPARPAPRAPPPPQRPERQLPAVPGPGSMGRGTTPEYARIPMADATIAESPPAAVAVTLLPDPGPTVGARAVAAAAEEEPTVELLVDTSPVAAVEGGAGAEERGAAAAPLSPGSEKEALQAFLSN